MKKIFLPLLALCGMVSCLTLTSCGGGGGGSNDGPAKALQNTTIETDIAMQVVGIELINAISTDRLEQLTTVDKEDYPGRATVKNVQPHGDGGYMVTVSLAFENSSDFVNDPNVQTALGNAGQDDDGDAVNAANLVYLALNLPIRADGKLGTGGSIFISAKEPEQGEEEEDNGDGDGVVELSKASITLTSGKFKTEYLK